MSFIKIIESFQLKKSQKTLNQYFVHLHLHFKREDFKRIKEAIKSGCKTDAPGSIACWFAKNSKMYAYLMPGSRYDIGTLDAYNKVKLIFYK